MTSFGQLASGRLNLSYDAPSPSPYFAETELDQLSRNIFELGHADNTIEVSGAGWNWEHTILDIEILCGHCHAITRSGINGHLCCAWAGRMYERYFQFNWADKR